VKSLSYGNFINSNHLAAVNNFKNNFTESILENDEIITDIACGPLHTLAVSNKNRIFSCGYGQSYALGHGNK